VYTSGTSGETKCVIIKNEAFMSEVLSIDQIIRLTDKWIERFMFGSGKDHRHFEMIVKRIYFS
jgi:acyl-coenzyme A synthetase/AMP-(fatty) acid ligase